MKADEVRKLHETDIEKKLADLRHKQKELRFGKARGELKNPLEKRQVKRGIARFLTILRERNN
jgi:ribosomal protein L29